MGNPDSDCDDSSASAAPTPGSSLVAKLADAQIQVRKKSGPARRRQEREARQRGQQLPQRRHHALAPLADLDAGDAELSFDDLVDLAQATGWVRDWEDQAPPPAPALMPRTVATGSGEREEYLPETLARAAARAAAARGEEALQSRLSAVRAAWADQNASRSLPEPLQAPAPGAVSLKRAPRGKRPHTPGTAVQPLSPVTPLQAATDCATLPPAPAPVHLVTKQDETGAWVLTTADPQAADAPSATDDAPASERLANNVGGTRHKHRRPAGQIVDARDRKHQLHEDLRTHRTTPRLSQCGVRPTGQDVAVSVGPSGLTSYAALRRCASVWACPVCAPKVRAARAKDLENYAAAWIARGGSKGKGGGLVMGTFTFAHQGKKHPLAERLDQLSEAWRRMRTYSRIRNLAKATNMVGFTRALEITHGRNGWHPHLHVLFWFDAPVDEKTTAKLEDAFFESWRTACLAVGLGEPKRSTGKDGKGKGVDLMTVKRGKEGAKALARYVAKVEGPDGVERSMGNEMMRGDLKTGVKAGKQKAGRKAESRTPFEVAQSGVDGSAADLKLWAEYELATHNHKALTWSEGLKKRLKDLLDIVEDSRTGEEIAQEEEVGSTRVALIRRDTWYQHIVGHRGRRIRLLRAYESLGEVGARMVIESWGLTWGTDIFPISKDHDTEQVSSR